jgi:hypothetical protein
MFRKIISTNFVSHLKGVTSQHRYENHSVNVQEREHCSFLWTKRFPTNALYWGNVELLNATEDVTSVYHDVSMGQY